MFLFYKGFADESDISDALYDVHKAVRGKGFTFEISESLMACIYDLSLTEMIPASLKFSDGTSLQGQISVDTILLCELVHDVFVVNPDFLKVHTSVDDRGLVVKLTNREQFLSMEELENLASDYVFHVTRPNKDRPIVMRLSVHQKGIGYEVSVNNSHPLLNSYDDRHVFRSMQHLVRGLYNCIKSEMVERNRVQIGQHAWIRIDAELPIVWQLQDTDQIS